MKSFALIAGAAAPVVRPSTSRPGLLRRLRRYLPVVAAVAFVVPGVAAATAAADPFAASLSPASGPSGTHVVVTGTQLQDVTQVIVYASDGSGKIIHPDVAATATTVKLTMPLNQAGSAQVNLYANQTLVATTTPLTFAYDASFPAPVITSITPTSGPLDGGTVIQVTGTGLTGINGATLGGVPAAHWEGVSDTDAIVITQPHAAGVVALTVSTAAGTATKASAFTFAAPNVPVITKISPNKGLSGVGGVFQISGTNLGTTSSVLIGTKKATIVSRSATAISGIAPAQPSGQYPVVVTSPSGANAPSAAATYLYSGLF